jgi:hypothetical protein
MRNKWIIAIVIAAAILSFLPYWISAPPFKQLIISILQQKYEAKLAVDHLRFSWLGPQRIIGVKITTPELNGTFDEIDANSPFWAIGKNYTLIGGNLQVPQSSASFENIQATIVGFKIDATGTTRSNAGTGKFSVQGTAIDQNQFNLTFGITGMPTAIVDWLLKMRGFLQSSIGSMFSLKGTASMQNGSGNVDLNLVSDTTTASVTASFTPDAITLTKPVVANFKLTPEMSLALSQNTVAVTGQDPIVLKISSNGFYFPRPFSLDKLKIGTASLEMGRIRLQNANYLSGLSVFLKTKKFDSNQVDAWLNEAAFSFDQGRLELERTDVLLANSIHLCGWGQTDVTRQTLDMILGVPADTLSKSFGIKNLSKNFVLQIPVAGTYKDPQFDASAATAKIAAIVAAGQVQKQGGVLGGIAGIASKAAQQSAPKPKPFPWDQ